MYFLSEQQRTAKNFHPHAGFARIAPSGIGREGAPTGIMRRCGARKRQSRFRPNRRRSRRWTGPHQSFQARNLLNKSEFCAFFRRGAAKCGIAARHQKGTAATIDSRNTRLRFRAFWLVASIHYRAVEGSTIVRFRRQQSLVAWPLPGILNHGCVKVVPPVPNVLDGAVASS
jgi:hypothetical protein